MNWRAHLFIGTSSGAAAAWLLRLDMAGALLFCSVSAAASLLPDLDIRNSKASQAAYAVAFIAALAASCQNSFARGGGMGDFALSFAVIAAALLALDALFRPRHRGVMHTLPFALCASAGCLLAFGAPAASAFLLGYCSHLASDRLLP